jgi:hypothetical protein
MTFDLLSTDTVIFRLHLAIFSFHVSFDILHN